VYKIRISDVNEQKERLRTEWAKLDHVVIVAAVHDWRRWWWVLCTCWLLTGTS